MALDAYSALLRAMRPRRSRGAAPEKNDGCRATLKGRAETAAWGLRRARRRCTTALSPCEGAAAGVARERQCGAEETRTSSLCGRACESSYIMHTKVRISMDLTFVVALEGGVSEWFLRGCLFLSQLR